MRYRFPYVGADLCKLILQPGISECCKTTAGVSRGVPVYSLVFAGYSIQPSHKGELRLSRPGAWFCVEVVYPSKDGHSPRH